MSSSGSVSSLLDVPPSPRICAAAGGNGSFLREALLNGESRVDEVDDQGRSALDIAIDAGKLENALFLLGKGAILEQRHVVLLKTKMGETARTLEAIQAIINRMFPEVGKADELP